MAKQTDNKGVFPATRSIIDSNVDNTPKRTIKNTTKGTSRVNGNIEIEKDEVILTPELKVFKAKGPTHANGGIPYFAEGGEFIYSNQIKLKGKDIKNFFSQTKFAGINPEIKSKILANIKKDGELDVSGLNISDNKEYSIADIASKFMTNNDLDSLGKDIDQSNKAAKTSSKYNLESKINYLGILSNLQELYKAKESQEQYAKGGLVKFAGGGRPKPNTNPVIPFQQLADNLAQTPQSVFNTPQRTIQDANQQYMLAQQEQEKHPYYEPSPLIDKTKALGTAIGTIFPPAELITKPMVATGDAYTSLRHYMAGDTKEAATDATFAGLDVIPLAKEAGQVGKIAKNARRVYNGVMGLAKTGNSMNTVASVFAKGGSVVDYLASKGMATDKKSRAALAQQLGIDGYNYSASKNTELLNRLQEAHNTPQQPATKGVMDFVNRPTGTGDAALDYMANNANGVNKYDQNPVLDNHTLRLMGYTGKDPKKQKADRDATMNNINSVNSDKADLFRALVPAPRNVSQMLAKQVLGDSRMTNNSLSDQEKLIAYDAIQNAIKRTGKNKGGTEYEDYGDMGYGSKQDFNDAWNHGKLKGALESVYNPGMKVASTIGRGSYQVDPETGKVMYTDVYDWNSSEKNYTPKDGAGLNPYQKIRNYMRGTEDKNLDANKNDANRMDFIFDPKEMEDIRARLHPTTQTVAANIRPEGTYKNGGQVEKMAGGGIPKWLSPWRKGNTNQGTYTSTGQPSTYFQTDAQLQDDYNYHKGLNGGKDFSNLKDYQSFIYNTALKNNPQSVSDMWSRYGQTNVNHDNPLINQLNAFKGGKPDAAFMGRQDVMSNFTDGKYNGARDAELSSQRYMPKAPRIPDEKMPPELIRPVDPSTVKQDTPYALPNITPVGGPMAPIDDSKPAAAPKKPGDGFSDMDIMSMYGALTSPINKYYPIREQVRATPNRWNNVDYEAQRQGIRGQVSEAQYAQSMFAAPQQQSASVGSFLKGQAMDGLNQSQMNEYNANSQGQMQVDMQNNAAQDNAYNKNQELTGNYHNQMTELNQNTDEAKAFKKQQIMLAYQNAVRNKSTRQLMGQLTPNYQIGRNFDVSFASNPNVFNQMINSGKANQVAGLTPSLGFSDFKKQDWVAQMTPDEQSKEYSRYLNKTTDYNLDGYSDVTQPYGGSRRR